MESISFFRFDRRKIVKIHETTETIFYNLYRGYDDNFWKSVSIPKSHESEAVVLFEVLGKHGAPTKGVLYLSKRYLKKDETFGYFTPKKDIINLIDKEINGGKRSRFFSLVKPLKEHKIELFGKIFQMKDANSFINEEKNMELHISNYGQYGINKLVIDGKEISTRTIGQEKNEWHLTERVVVIPKVTNTNLPCYFGGEFFLTEGLNLLWKEDKIQYFEDTLFRVSIESYLDENQDECFNFIISWK